MPATRAAMVLSLALLSGCRQQLRVAHGVDGEWTIRLWLDAAGPARPATTTPIDGKVVIGGRISDLYNQQEAARRPPFPYRAGRFYADLAHFFGPGASPRRRSAFDTTGLAAADLGEELMARSDSPTVFTAFVAPHVMDAGLQLRGRQRGDTVTGTWQGAGWGTTPGPRGHFRMLRVPRTRFSDSAEARTIAAKRAWREWNPDADPEATVVTDTALVAPAP
jgi:hypothetical protein